MKNILIIEDSIDIRENTAEILEMSGYHVLQAGDGKDGIETAEREKPHLILCDIMMPEMSGFSVLSALSKNPETASIPFIFLTARAERADIRKGMDMGADDYLTKPFNDIELLSAIECRLNKTESQKQYYSKTLQNLQKLTAGLGDGNKELANLIGARKVKLIKKKQILYYEGDQPQGIYLVLKGSLKTLKIAKDGKELITNIYHEEDYLGINALLLDEVFTETAEAVEDAAVCLLLKDSVIELLNRYPEIGKQFIKILSNNVREKEEQLLELAYHSVRKRLASLLIRLDSPQSGTCNNFKISRDELAAISGMAAETVSRTLSDFQTEGLIEKRASHMLILDHDRLVNMKN